MQILAGNSSSTEAIDCPPHSFLDVLTAKYYNSAKIAQCFFKISKYRYDNLENRLRKYEKSFAYNDMRRLSKHSFETIGDVYEMASFAHRNQKDTHSLEHFHTIFSDALFNTREKPSLQLNIGNNARRGCMRDVQRRNLASLLSDMELRRTIARPHLDAMRAFLPSVHSFAGVRYMADLACPRETQLDKTFSKERFLDDLTRAFGWEYHITDCYRKYCMEYTGVMTETVWIHEMTECLSTADQLMDKCRNDFETILKRKMRYAKMNFLIESYADARMVTIELTSLGHIFNTKDDVGKLSSKIYANHDLLKKKMTDAEAFEMFHGGITEVLSIRDRHYQACYRPFCPRCPWVPIHSNFAQWKAEMKKGIQMAAPRTKAQDWQREFDNCISMHIYREALLSKLYEYEANNYITLGQGWDINNINLYSYADVSKLANKLKTHMKTPAKKMTKVEFETCYQENLDEFSSEFFEKKYQCFRNPSDLRSLKFKELLTKYKNQQIIQDWDKFGFDENAEFVTIDHVYILAEAAYRARTPQFTDLTYKQFLDEFFDAFFYTKIPRYGMNWDYHNCYSTIETRNLQLLLRYGRHRFFSRALIEFVPNVHSMEGVRKIARMACPGYIEPDELSTHMIEYDLTVASGLKTNMCQCHDKSAQSLVIESDMNEELSQKTRENIKKCEEECTCTAKETPWMKKAKVTNRIQILNSYVTPEAMERQDIVDFFDSNRRFSSDDASRVAQKIYSFHRSTQKSKQLEVFRNDLMKISGFYSKCFKTVTEYTDVDCSNRDECLNEINKHAPKKKFMQKSKAKKLEKEFQKCVSQAFSGKSKSEFNNQLENRLVFYKRNKWIGSDVKMSALKCTTPVPVPELIIEECAMELYRYFLQETGP